MRADQEDRPRRSGGAGASIGRVASRLFWIGVVLLLVHVGRPDWLPAARDQLVAALSPPPAQVPVTHTPEEAPAKQAPAETPPLADSQTAAGQQVAPVVRAEAPGGRQTSFNDDNYVPRPLVNVMESRHVRQYAQSQPRRIEQPRQRGLNGTGTATFFWEDARGRRSRWQTAYSYRNSLIDTASFCSNYRRGSIDYRTCRKGAKAWLGERCGNGNRVAGERQRMYCHAHSGFGL